MPNHIWHITLNTAGEAAPAGTANGKAPHEHLAFRYACERALEEAAATHAWLKTDKLVAKPDQLIKRRGKAGLLCLNANSDEAKNWILDRAGKNVRGLWNDALACSVEVELTVSTF